MLLRALEMYVDQNFDTYSVEYTYSDGTKFFFDGRTIPGCEQIYSSYLQGTKGSGIASYSVPTNGRSNPGYSTVTDFARFLG